MLKLIPVGDKFLDMTEYDIISEITITIDETISNIINRADGECYGLSLIYVFKNLVIDLTKSIVVDKDGVIRDFSTLNEMFNTITDTVTIGGVKYNISVLKNLENLFTVVSKFNVTFDNIINFTSSFINLTELGVESDFILRDDVCGTDDIILDYPHADFYNYEIENYLDAIGLCPEFKYGAIKLFNKIIKDVNEAIPNIYSLGSVRLKRISYNTIKVEVIPLPSSRRYHLKRMLDGVNRKSDRDS